MSVKNINKKSVLFLNIVFIIIVLFLGFIILSPKMSSRFSSESRKMLWSEFSLDLEKTKDLDGKKFWKFREFYSPGSFVFNREGLTDEEIGEFFKEINIPLKAFLNDLIFLKYESKYIQSVEALSDKLVIEDIVGQASAGKVISQGREYILVKKDDKTFYLYFLLTNEELKKANGFLDYAEEDRDLVKDKKWFGVSKIVLD